MKISTNLQFVTTSFALLHDVLSLQIAEDATVMENLLENVVRYYNFMISLKCPRYTTPTMANVTTLITLIAFCSERARV